MNAKPHVEINANHAATAPAFLSVWEVEAYYGESYIVQNISFNIHEGEILALLIRNCAMARSGWITSRCTRCARIRPPPAAWRWCPRTAASFPA
jgi:hypothetical protein